VYVSSYSSSSLFLVVSRLPNPADDPTRADQPTLKVYGRSILQSRRIAAFSTVPSLPLKYSGASIDMHYPFPSVLDTIRTRVEDVLSGSGEVGDATVRFNHCMLNYYEDGNVYIGYGGGFGRRIATLRAADTWLGPRSQETLG
jgi:hypothetical protein